jgi:uncharacterized protein
MIWSKYNYLFKSDIYGHILYNSVTQTLLQIPEDDIVNILSLKNNPDSYINFEDKEFLLDSKIIVENEYDDLALHAYKILKTRYNPTSMSLTIAVTRDCNFNCAYCYEEDRVAIYLNEQTGNAIIEFIKKNKNLKSLFVVWYGGEPLLNYAGIKRLTSKIKDLNIEYAAMIVTNGYLLTEDKANEFENLSIHKVQVTIDGEEYIHNARRPLKNGKETYRTIIANMKKLLELNPNILIDVRTNIDRTNSDTYSRFNTMLKANFGTDRVRPYTGFVSDMLSSGCISDDKDMSNRDTRVNFFIKNFEENHVNIKNFMPSVQLSTCIANNLTGFVIGPEGELYKCWLYIGKKEHVIGNVRYPDELDQNVMARFLCGADYLFDDNCRNCNLIHICNGGCPLARILNKYENKNIDYCCTAKSNLEKYIEMHLFTKKQVCNSEI